MPPKNHITLIGNLTGPPTLTYAGAEGIPALNFRIAVDRDQQPGVDFLPVSYYGEGAEALYPLLKKGSLVTVIGRMASRDIKGNGGKRKTAYYVEAEVVVLARE